MREKIKELTFYLKEKTFNFVEGISDIVTVNKANKLLGLVYRAVSSSNPGAFSTLYKSLERPVPEYAAPV